MSQSTGRPMSILQKATAAAGALIILSTGVYFALRGGGMERGTSFVQCTATGGLAAYAYCNWQEPTGNSGSGVIITRMVYSVGESPKVIGIDGTIGASATTSGATAIARFTDFQTSTGTTIVYDSTGAVVVPEGNYVRLVTLTAPTATHTASLMIDWVTRLSK